MTDSDVTLPLVLLIDDDPTVHLWAKRHLSFAGFKLVSALNGDEGIELFQVHFPDIVLVDVEMPGLERSKSPTTSHFFLCVLPVL